MTSRELQLQTTTNHALLHIYDAVSNPIKWEYALDTLVDICGCKSAILSVSDVSAKGSSSLSDYELTAISHSLRSKPSAIAEYFNKFGPQEAEEFAFIQNTPIHQIIDDSFVWSDVKKVRNRADFQYRRIHFDVFRRFAVRLNDNSRWSEIAMFQLGAANEEIPLEVRQNVSALVPHIAKAVELGRTFVELKRRYNATLCVLDKVKIGLGLIRRDGTVLVANEEAKRILDQASGIRLSKSGKVVLRDPDISSALSKAINSVVHTAEGLNNIAEFKTSLKHNSKRKVELECFLEIAPMRDTLNEINSKEGYALLTLIDPDNVGSVSIDRLSLAYKLNTSESDVCRLLVEGRTQAEVADIREVSYETIKSQSKVILKKTGARSRAELIRLALKVSPPIES